MSNMSKQKNSALSRRGILAGAGVAGAAAVAAATLGKATGGVPAVVAAAPAAPEQVSGYRVTAHVLRYYQTARV